MRSKGLISLNFSNHVSFKDFYTKLCAVLTNKRNYIERNFYSVAVDMPKGWDLGCFGGGGGVKNFCVGICDGAPLTAHSSILFQTSIYYQRLKGVFL